jgi:uncharacterized membrane protein YkvA (DUF1232 family)
MAATERWKSWAKSLKREAQTMLLAIRDRRTPWYAKALGCCVVAYALSPIDLIPDPIPVLGYLDDLLIVPAGIWLVRRLIPPAVLADARARIEAGERPAGRLGYLAAGAVVAAWVATVVIIAWVGYRRMWK